MRIGSYQPLPELYTTLNKHHILYRGIYRWIWLNFNILVYVQRVGGLYNIFATSFLMELDYFINFKLSKTRVLSLYIIKYKFRLFLEVKFSKFNATWDWTSMGCNCLHVPCSCFLHSQVGDSGLCFTLGRYFIRTWSHGITKCVANTLS